MATHFDDLHANQQQQKLSEILKNFRESALQMINGEKPFDPVTNPYVHYPDNIEKDQKIKQEAINKQIAFLKSDKLEQIIQKNIKNLEEFDMLDGSSIGEDESENVNANALREILALLQDNGFYSENFDKLHYSSGDLAKEWVLKQKENGISAIPGYHFLYNLFNTLIDNNVLKDKGILDALQKLHALNAKGTVSVYLSPQKRKETISPGEFNDATVGSGDFWVATLPILYTKLSNKEIKEIEFSFYNKKKSQWENFSLTKPDTFEIDLFEKITEFGEPEDIVNYILLKRVDEGIQGSFRFLEKLQKMGRDDLFQMAIKNGVIEALLKDAIGYVIPEPLPLRYLIQHYPTELKALLNKPIFDGHVPLAKAVLAGNESSFQILRTFGADLSGEGKEAIEELFKNALTTKSPKPLQYLIQHYPTELKALLNKPIIDGMVPIRHALYTGNAHTFQMLLELGADVMAEGKAKFKEDCRYAAKSTHKPEIFLRGLLGTNVDQVKGWNHTLLKEAVRAQKYHNLLYLCRNNPNLPDALGYTAGLWALELLKGRDLSVMINTLAHHGLKLNEPDFYGNTLLTLACRDKQFAVGGNGVSALIQDGAKVNVPDKKGNSPLLNALLYATEESSDIVEVLLKNGADVFQKDANGDLPIEVAVSKGFPDLIKLIAQKTLTSLPQKIEELVKTNKMDELREMLLRIYSSIKDKSQWDEAISKAETEGAISHEMVATINKLIEEQKQKLEQWEKEITFLINQYDQVQNDASYEAMLKRIAETFSIPSIGLMFEEYLQAKNYPHRFKLFKNWQILSECLFHFTAGRVAESQKIFRRNRSQPLELIELFCSSNPKNKSMKAIGTICFGSKIWPRLLFNTMMTDPAYPNLLKKLALMPMDFADGDAEGNSLLHMAIRGTKLEVFKQLFEGKNTKEAQEALLRKEYKICPLRLALQVGANDIFEYLLQKGANPIYGCSSEFLPLAEYAKTETQKEILDNYKKIYFKEREAKVVGEQKSTLERAPLLTSEERIRANRFAHLMGVKSIYFTATDSSTNIHAELQVGGEGATLQEGFTWVAECLRVFIEKDPNKFIENDLKKFQAYKEISEAYQFTLNHLYGKGDRFALVDRYNRGEMIVLPIEWAQHSMTAVMQNGWLSFSNRGAGGDQQYGTKIYPIRPGVDIAKFISEIFIDMRFAVSDEIFSPEDTQLLVKTSLNRVVDLSNPFDQLDQKGQNIGNCSTANAKAAIQGANYIQQIQERLKSKKSQEVEMPKIVEENKDKARIKETEKGENEVETLQALKVAETKQTLETEAKQALDAGTIEALKAERSEMKTNSKTFYKDFTNPMRDTEIDTILLEIRTRHDKRSRSEYYYDKLVSFILDHMDSSPADKKEASFDKKGGHQGKRICQIWEELPLHYQKLVLDRYPAFEKMKAEYVEKYKEKIPMPFLKQFDDQRLKREHIPSPSIEAQEVKAGKEQAIEKPSSPPARPSPPS